MLTADLRCSFPTCGGRDIYRMVGHCTNCNQADVLMLLTEEHEARDDNKCPKCGTKKLRADRLATDDEIPLPSHAEVYGGADAEGVDPLSAGF